ncbi:MAG TPA: hypothetical protein VIQ05_10625 [Tardiphaga sp.]
MINNREGSSTKMWGWPLDVWDGVAFWTLVAGSLLAAAAVALTGFSSFVSWKTASITQRISDEKIADATARGDAARADAAKAMSETAKANERAAELALAIEARKNRTFTETQKKAIVDRLVPLPDKGKVLINVLMSDGEAFQFSDQVLSVLKDAGYDVEEVPQRERLLALNRTGLFLWMHDAHNPPERAKNIATAFRLVGIDMLGDTQPNIDPDVIVLVVGSHP